MTVAASALSPVYPLGTRVNHRGHLEIGGCDTVELAREFGTPAYIVAENDLRARARTFIEEIGARHADFDVLFASKAFPCTAVCRVLAAKGWPAMWPRVGSWRWRCGVGLIPPGSTRPQPSARRKVPIPAGAARVRFFHSPCRVNAAQ